MLSTRLVRLQPLFMSRPWGHEDLAPWYSAPGQSSIGEVWLSSDQNPTALGCNVAALGQSLPLVKFLFTRAALSVQVHPTEEFARSHLGHGGKTEAWYVLRSEPQSRVALGFSQPVSEDDVRESITRGELESLLGWHIPRVGECLLVPAGTVHAIGAGLAILEIQQPHDVTFRLYDYGRPRELHLEQALRVADFGEYSAKHVSLRHHELPAQRLAEGRGFVIESHRGVAARSLVRVSDAPAVLVALTGQGALDGEPFSPGSAFLRPARSGAVHVETRGLPFELVETWLE